jgi:PIN domain nuclease of toxin-antitoxin system
MPSADPLLLDTHAWVWLNLGEAGVFSRARLSAIERAAAEGRLRIAVISVWEVGMLAAKGRVHFGIPVADWVRGALAHPGIALADLTPEIALEACALPGALHGDPADRIIVATARALGATLLTRDRAILRYSRGGHVKAAALG